MRLAWFVLMAGCGRIGFDPLAGPPGGDGSMVDCPATYTQTATGCYRFEIRDPNVGLDWSTAEQFCEDEGGHLAVIGDAAELASIATIVPGNLNDAFVGVSDRITPDVYLTVTGDLAFTPWASGNPDAADGCMEIRNTDLTVVFDNSCGDDNDFLCEIDGIPPDPTAF